MLRLEPMRTGIVCGVLVVAAAAGRPHGQASSAFDVASVKPSAPGLARVGLRIDASHVEFNAVSMMDLLRAAFQVSRDQVRGPAWLSGGVSADRFDVRAALPRGVGAGQIPAMLQTLLAERFELVFHREQHEHAVFALSVAASGPHLEPSTNAASADPPPAPRMSMTPDGAMRLEADGLTMTAFADTLSRYVDRPVVDRTGLSGAYRVTVTLSREDVLSAARSAGLPVPPETPVSANGDGVAGVSIVRSLAELGLALVSRNAPIDEIVIDRLARTPTPD